jgi:heme/copper-type cytochrome/quinol oxidase subunit 3
MSTSYRVLPLPGVRPVGRPLGWWGIVLVIATESAFFAFLLFSYFYSGSVASGPWPPHGAPELTLTGINTLLLLSSSGAMWWGERGIRNGDARRLMWGLAGTLLLGIAFLTIQAVEYSHKTFTPRTDAYGSLFFTITGFHGAHVAVGIIMVAVTLVRAALGHFGADRRTAVSVTALYWHFVDAVWLAVFTSLYLTPRLGLW